MSAPILVVDWRQDFMAALAEHLATGRSPAELARLRVVFPHNRPARHLRAALAAQPALPRPCLLPRMHSFDDFVHSLRRELFPEAALRAGRLDRIGVLHGIVRGLGLEGGPLAGLDASAREFFPWGARLASLLEEMAVHGVRPLALGNLEGEVSPWASALLGQLDAIASAYRAELAARGWTTPGLDCQLLAHNPEGVADVLGQDQVLFAGFHAPAGAEETILRGLWNAGAAEIIWHSDPALAQGGSVEWAAREHGKWLAGWKARAQQLGPALAAPPQQRRFYEGFDLHSQLKALERELSALPDTTSTAIVLPDPGALVPVMHHLPPADVNISMGYPLARSSLAQLVETILVLHENARPAAPGRPRAYAWRDLVALVRQPLLRMLRAGQPDDPQPDAPQVDDAPKAPDRAPLKAAYLGWERRIRAAGAFQSLDAWSFVYESPEGGVSEAEALELHQEVIRACFDNFAELTTLRQAGQALDALCALLRRRGGDVWKRHLMDAECLLRLWQSVVPELTGSVLADETFDQGLIFLMLRHLIDGERVSFEPEPLAGMQVLGMLETRLLSFCRLFILDATEDKLPGASPPDPLLPDTLRSLLGLPARKQRDAVAAHNFFRLVMGARELTVFYQAGVRPGALEGKSERSRYVEQLLWKHEEGQGELLKGCQAPQNALPAPDAGPLFSIGFPACPIVSRPDAVVMGEALRARLERRFTERGITPSGLEQWIACPKKAFFAQCLNLRPLQESAEDDGRARLGELAHATLKDFLSPHLGQRILPGTLDWRPLAQAFENGLRATDEAALAALPRDARLALLHAGRERLKRFVDSLPGTTVLALELPLLTGFALRGMDGRRLESSLHGRADRVDLRDGGRLVLDYKTGSVKSAGAAPWLDEDFFQRMDACEPGSPETGLFMRELAEAGLDVQLPLYLHLLALTEGPEPVDAAWVELATDGGERLLFGPDVDGEARRGVVGLRAPQLARFVLEHVLAAETLPPMEGRQCQWCDFKGPCGA